MKAKMEVMLDTTWTNQVRVSVECEFDNPHSLTARALSELMVARLKLLAEEVRHASERGLSDLDIIETAEESRRRGETASGTPERERQAYIELQEEQRRGAAERREEVVPNGD